MFTKTTRNRLAAAALAVGSLGLAAPAMAAPLGLDAGLHRGADGIVAVQYGYGHHDGWNRHGFGGGHRRHWGGGGPHWGHHHRHHGHWGRPHGPRWGHHHHHGHWGRHHGHW